MVEEEGEEGAMGTFLRSQMTMQIYQASKKEKGVETEEVPEERKPSSAEVSEAVRAEAAGEGVKGTVKLTG